MKKVHTESLASEADLDLQDQDDGSVAITDPQQESKAPETESEPEETEVEASDTEETEEEESPKESKRHAERVARRERQKRARELREEKLQDAYARIAQLEDSLAKVQKTQEHIAYDRLEDDIRVQEDLIVRIKSNLETVEDRKIHTELVDRLSDEKLRLREMQAKREQQAQRPAPKKPVIPRNAERLAREWMSRNSWYDPEGSTADSKMVLAIDSQLTEEKWDPSTDDYWHELEDRVRQALPHRFNQARRSAPVTSSRNENSKAPVKTNPRQFILSKERKEALIDAGIWDDPVARDRHIKAYQRYDREHAMDNI